MGRPSAEARVRWTGLKDTVKAQAAIEALLANNEELNSKHFEPEWGEDNWVEAISVAQDWLCVWCTVDVRKGGDTGDIDHVRPRTEVTRDILEVGTEVGTGGRVRGRRLFPRQPLRPGYHWRAYDPNNLALCCKRCNTGWKRTLWPVRPRPDPPAWRAPDPNVEEYELILDPFVEGFDPLSHFQFGPQGAMIPRGGDERADATMATVRLDRQFLCDARAIEYNALEGYAHSILRAVNGTTPDAQRDKILKIVADRCAWSSPHAAFYRVALKRTLTNDGVMWSKLQKAWDRLKLATGVLEPPDDAWVE